MYAVWPELPSTASPTYITYATGAMGAFLFIVGGYLGYVEAINQTFQELRIPTPETKVEPRTFRRLKDRHYGKHQHPLGANLTTVDKVKLEAEGYPLVYVDGGQELVSAKDFFENKDDDLVGTNLLGRIGNRNVELTINLISLANEDEKSLPESHEGYCWWTWQPDLQYIGIFNSLVFFVATVS